MVWKCRNLFPEFLPEQAPQIVLNLWDTTKDYWIFRYRLPYRNYGMIQSFIVALGRKTELDNIWRTGIHIARKEGNFKVALEQEGAEHNLMIYIDKTVVKDRLVFIFDTLRGDLKGGSWELSVDIGQQYQPFDLKDWKKNTQRESEALEQQESRAAVDRKTIVNENVKKKQSKKAKKKAKKKSKKNAGRIGHEVGNKKLKDEEQWRNVPRDILFAAANPSEKARMATDKEHETIEKEMRLGDERHLYNIKKPLLAVTFDNLMRAIQKLDRPNIIHFAGHGIEQGIIIVDDNNNSEVLRNDLLEDIFKEFGERTELVILNCCYSAAQAALISKLGILVIGYNTEIGDSAAIKFIKGFYVGISQGKSYKKAFALGRIYLKQKKSASLNKLEVWLNGSILKW